MNSQQMTFFEEPDVHLGGVSCISGGFPCQPHSVAGKRKASGDERDLWPEMRRVIGEIKPRWVVAENVRGLLSSENGRFFLGVLRDFADLGYDVGWGVTSAAAVGAIHRRERVALVAHASSERLQGRLQKGGWFSANVKSEGAFNDLLQKADADYLSESAICGIHDGIRERLGEIKAYGNAVVPQQFYPIFEAIAKIERQEA